MSYTTTAGKVLLKHYSPDSLHTFLDTKELDKKNIGNFFTDLSSRHPDLYKKTVSDLARLGFESSTRLGSTVKLTDLLPPKFKAARFKKLNEDVAVIKNKKLSQVKEEDELGDLLGKFSDEVNKELVEEGVKENKTLAKVVKAGARGSPTQYRQTVFSPVAVNNNEGGIMTDFIIDRSFAEGLTLPQYLAHSFGSRQSSAAGKLNVSEGGYVAKQLARAGMTMVVSEHDCGTTNGIPASTSDHDYIGSLLAKPVDKYHANNKVTSSMLSELRTKNIDEIIVRSPITCQAGKHSFPTAVCQLCAGYLENGLPAIGSYLGITSGSSLAEPIAQSTLNSKHQGGSAKARLEFGGNKYINQLLNIPASFLHEAPIALKDGVVEEVKEASQGGHYVVLKHGDKLEEHYVNPDLKVTVKKGQAVEEGDVLSEGIPHPAKIVKHKGIGEGRVYFSKQLQHTFENSGLGGINKRNFDTVAKGIITHVKVNEPKGLGDYLPDSIVNYHSLEKDYTPRSDSKKVRTDAALGMYLETPELHYTIGTRLTSSMLNNLKKHKIDYVIVHEEPPGFEPEMQRLLDVPMHEQDWLHTLYSTNLERRLMKAVNTGASSDLHGPSPVAGLAYSAGFGNRKLAEEEEAFDFEG